MTLGDTVTATQLDLSGNANNGTVTGATLDSGPAQDYLRFLNRNDRSFIAIPLGMMEWLRQRKIRVTREEN
jgi:hypothetical protein